MSAGSCPLSIRMNALRIHAEFVFEMSLYGHFHFSWVKELLYQPLCCNSLFHFLKSGFQFSRQPGCLV